MNFVSIEVVEQPLTLPVTVDEFIDQGRLNALTVDRQPNLILRELSAATQRAQRYLRRSIITQTLRAWYAPDGKNCLCTQMLMLPRGRVQAVTSITSQANVLDAAAYRLEGNTVVLQSPLYAAAEVVWVSGYGDTGDDVPDIVKEGILEYATVLYCDRNGIREAKYAAGASGKTLPRGIMDLWRPEQIEISG